MPHDPFATSEAFNSLQQFLERLAVELHERRKPLEDALRDLLLVARLDYGRHVLAAQLAEAGTAIRDAGLGDEVRRMYLAREALDSLPSGAVVGFALLDAAAGDDANRVGGLLALLHNTYPHLKPQAWDALAQGAEQLLVVWCDRQAADYPARFRDEVRRLGLDLHRVDEWHCDHAPTLTPAAELVLDRLLNGMPFALGWFTEPIDLDELGDVIAGEADATSTEVVAPEKNVSASTPAEDPTPAAACGKKPGIPKAEAESRVAAWLAVYGYTAPDPMKITVRMVADATGLPGTSSVGRLGAWRKFCDWREQQRGGEPRTRQLVVTMQAVIPDRAAEDPAESAAQNEENEMLERLLARATTEEERTRFRNMNYWERQTMLEAFDDIGLDEADCKLPTSRRGRSLRP